MWWCGGGGTWEHYPLTYWAGTGWTVVVGIFTFLEGQTGLHTYLPNLPCPLCSPSDCSSSTPDGHCRTATCPLVPRTEPGSHCLPVPLLGLQPQRTCLLPFYLPPSPFTPMPPPAFYPVPRTGQNFLFPTHVGVTTPPDDGRQTGWVIEPSSF